MNDDTPRREFLLSLIQAAIAGHDKWVASDHLYVTAATDTAMTDLIDGFSEGGIPADCRELQQRVSEFSDHWHAWQADMDRRGSATVPPPETCWKAWEALITIYRGITTPVRRAIESVATLRSQQVPDRQICEIYGWMDARGCPEVWRVEEEMVTPGKHTIGWVDPVTRHREQTAEAQKTLMERVRRMRERKMAIMESGPPESLADLVYQKVPLRQIAEMLRITEAEVLTRCDAEGLDRPPAPVSIQSIPGQFEQDLPPEAARQFASQRAEGDRLQAEAESRSARSAADLLGADADIDSNALTLEQQIIQHHREGFSPADIAEVLTSETEKVSTRKVQAVLKRYEEDPDAFVAPAN